MSNTSAVRGPRGPKYENWPLGDPRAIQGFLQQTQADTVLMVSHLPLVGLLVDYLTGETGTRMGTANLASLSMDFPAQGTASLNWIHHAN